MAPGPKIVRPHSIASGKRWDQEFHRTKCAQHRSWPIAALVRCHAKRVAPPPLPVALPVQKEPAAEDPRPEPTPLRRYRDVAVPPVPEDLEVDRLGPGVDDPVLGDPGAVIGFAKRLCVLLQRVGLTTSSTQSGVPCSSVYCPGRRLRWISRTLPAS